MGTKNSKEMKGLTEKERENKEEKKGGDKEKL